jgi:hypothetical protein
MGNSSVIEIIFHKVQEESELTENQNFVIGPHQFE